MAWFLIALFECRSLYDFMQYYLKNHVLLISIWTLSLVGYICTKITLPLSLDIVLLMLPICYFGTEFKYIFFVEKNKKIKFIFGFLFIWSVIFISISLYYHTFFEIAPRRIPLFPFCLLMTIAGSSIIIYFSQLIVKLKIIKPMIFIGKNSLYFFFFVHALDFWYIDIYSYFKLDITRCLVRILVDFVVFLILFKVVNLIKNELKFTNNKKIN